MISSRQKQDISLESYIYRKQENKKSYFPFTIEINLHIIFIYNYLVEYFHVAVYLAYLESQGKAEELAINSVENNFI